MIPQAPSRSGIYIALCSPELLNSWAKVVAKATTAPANPQGTSVQDAAKANQIKLSLNNWQPVGGKVQITPTATDNFYGRGQLTVENTSQQALTLYMPVGTIFTAADSAFQDVAGYATNVQVTNPQVAQQLPATGGGTPSPALLIGALGLTMLAAGCHVLRARIRTM